MTPTGAAPLTGRGASRTGGHRPAERFTGYATARGLRDVCGIGGIARIDGCDLDDSADLLLREIADVLAHRGPDDRELLRDGPLGFAFTRLSLVDPDTGGQPLVSADGNIVLIANGEVYNHRELAATLPDGVRLRTGSDCEVLLYLYQQHGRAFLDRVRGMFGLVIWDKVRRRLILARDRFGVKPLYYHRDARRVVFGSEIKSLFRDPAVPRRLDWRRVLGNPHVSAAPELAGGLAPDTWFEGVEMVPAGTIREIELRDGTTRDHVYWRFPTGPSTADVSAEELVARYRELFIDSVTECATADTELGLFLSGGIDSAAVGAIAARTTSLHTFTVLSASTYRNGDAEHAHRVARMLGQPNHQVVFPTEAVPSVDEWKRLLWLLEHPMCGPEVYYKHELHRYAKAARPEIRGMLLGAASDEFNGGYSESFAGDGGGYPEFEANLRTMVRGAALARRPELAPWWLSQPDLLNDDVFGQAAAQALRDPVSAYFAWESVKVQQYNCWHEDRTAAGSGIEARVPFLDHRLVELSATVPPHLRQELLWDKRILRRAMRGLLPPEIIERPKVPFFYGARMSHTYHMLTRMLAQQGGALVEEALAAPGAAAMLNPDGIRRALADPATASSEGPTAELILRLVNIGLLAGMVTDLPKPTARTPVGPCPSATEILDWETARPENEKRFGLDHGLTDDSTPALADNVMLLSRPGRTGAWYLAVDGQLEFELGEDSMELAVLSRLDGERRLAQILAESGQDPVRVRPLLVDLIEQDLVTVAPVPDTTEAA